MLTNHFDSNQTPLAFLLLKEEVCLLLVIICCKYCPDSAGMFCVDCVH